MCIYIYIYIPSPPLRHDMTQTPLKNCPSGGVGKYGYEKFIQNLIALIHG